MTAVPARRRTLLVDDAEELRYLVRLVLERSGRYEVVAEAADGHEAIASAVAHGEALDLVLLDLSMPRMDGLEALPHVRRAAPGARVVVLSGFAEAGTAEAARLAGADLYLEKGLAPDVLLAALDGTDLVSSGVAGTPTTTVIRPAAAPPAANEVVGRLAHDVRTPLLTARGAVSLVREQLGSLAPDLEDIVARAESALDRVDRTLTAAVEHARIGAAPLTPRRVEVREVLVEAVAAVGPQAENRTTVRGRVRHVLADRDALRRIVVNLVDNAVRYSDGPIELVISDADGRVAIDVRDHGPGFGVDGQDLFAPFARGPAGRDRPGTGLGLATAADVTRRLGGDLSAADRGDGATVTVRLPAAD
ncbi:ATP-binding response regulator [Nitriliruptor alkaliphilus]|uniref:ATP-binding response regulator n=1 Tax=Nitriliruptor alkaliphilus TaxID=427918 RepID=UPI0006986680|nr:response regulator [Nitriliruptor alkaliphilus]